MQTPRIHKVDAMLDKCFIIKSKFYKSNKINRSRIIALIKKDREVSDLYKEKVLTALLKLQDLINKEIDKLLRK